MEATGSAHARLLEALQALGRRHNAARTQWQCPAHSDQKPSLSVNQSDGGVLVKCHKGCNTTEVVAALGLTTAQLFDKNTCSRKKLHTTYDYTNEHGTLLFQTIRMIPKDFRQRRPDGNGGWIWGLGATRRVVYRLPELLAGIEADSVIYIAEGEKDVDAIRAAGCVATCNPMGAEKKVSPYRESFNGATKVMIVADKDADGKGLRHARAWEAALRGVAKRVEVVEAVQGKDAHDALVKHRLPVAEAFRPVAEGETPAAEPTESESHGIIELAEKIRSESHYRPSLDGRLYRYGDGVYRLDGEQHASGRVREEMGTEFRRRHLAEVLTYLRTFPRDIPEKPPTDRLNLANGLYEWKTGRLGGHDPRFLTAVQHPVKWNPNARCPQLKRFLIESLGEDCLPFIYELIGYLLYPGNPLRTAVLFFGFGRNGKTVLLSILKALIGMENISTISLQTLSENRFASADLYGKIANICGDLDARSIRQTDTFKMLTGGDPMRAERKRRDAFTFQPFAVPVFSANEVPLSSDQSQGWFDRWVVVPFPNRVAEEDVDPHLTAKLTTPEELEGLLVHAMEGLRCLMDRGRFNLPAAVQAEGERYRDRVDSVRGFISESCVLHTEAWCKRSDFYRAYRTWCHESGRHPVSRQTANDHIRQNYAEKVIEKPLHGFWRWVGIGILEGA